MNIGNLYLVKQWHWLLFPTKEVADAYAALDAAVAAIDAAVAATDASYLSKHFNCNVTSFSPDSYIVFLEEDGMLKRVLTGEGKIGWIWFEEVYNDCFEEMKP